LTRIQKSIARQLTHNSTSKTRKGNTRRPADFGWNEPRATSRGQSAEHLEKIIDGELYYPGATAVQKARRAPPLMSA